MAKRSSAKAVKETDAAPDAAKEATPEIQTAKPEKPQATYPAAAIASLLMLTPRRIQQLAQQGIIPKAAHGRYELAPAVQGYIRFLQERQIGSSAPSGQFIDYHAEKARLVKAQADIAEVNASRARAEVLLVEEVEQAWGAVADEIRANFLGQVPGRIAARVRGLSDETALKRAIKDELSLGLRALAAANPEEILKTVEIDEGGDDPADP